MHSQTDILRGAALAAVLFAVAPRAGAITVFPDYFNIEIPPNIAPLNFNVEGVDGGSSDVSMTAEDGEVLSAEGPEVRFPMRKWRKFMEAHAGQRLVGVLHAGDVTYAFTNRISRHPISTHLTYRLIPPGYSGFKNVGIYQRDLTTFYERPLYRNVQSTTKQCVNCHTYNACDPGQYLFHTRAHDAGTVVVSEKYGKMKIQPSLPNGYTGGVYPAWHPSGDYVAFSCNDTSQLFYSHNRDKIEVLDSRSDLFLYRLKDGQVTMIEDNPLIFECFPCWSPDGKALVTSSSRSPFKTIPNEEEKRERQLQTAYTNILYDIVIRTFDESTLTFSRPQIVMDAQRSRKSFTLPRFSPDGRWIVFVAGPYGVFNIWHKSADLCIIDLKNKSVRVATEINSADTESYHCFSKDGRWMVFSSRRNDGLYTRPYFAAFDPETGTFAKPFMLPVEDPDDHYMRQLSYNIPELSDGPVRESPRDLRRIVESSPR